MGFSPDGWRTGATRRQTANCYPGVNARRIIVMHYTAGYQASSAVNTFLDTEASKPSSAHFVVEADGEVTQMVSTDDGAWHAGGGEYRQKGRVNEFSIGVEIVNPGYHFRSPDGGFLNWRRQPVPAERLSPFLPMIEAADPWVGSAPVWWPSFPEAQLSAVEDLTQDLLETYSSITDIVGHRDIDHLRRLKVDPGPAFPLRRFRALLDRRDDPDRAGLAARVSTLGGALNVRGGPGSTFDTLDWGPLQNGAMVEVLEERGEWSLVASTEGGHRREGWAYARYLAPR